MNKEQIFKLLENKIDTAQTLALECIEIFYKAVHNEAIDQAIAVAQNYMYSDAHNLEIEDLEKLKL